MGNEQLTNA